MESPISSALFNFEPPQDQCVLLGAQDIAGPAEFHGSGSYFFQLNESENLDANAVQMIDAISEIASSSRPSRASS